MEWEFAARVIAWRGPAPYVFAPMPKRATRAVEELARGVAYWGQVPVVVTIGATEFTTAMWPRDGRYLVPIKLAVQRAEDVEVGDRIRVRLHVRGRR